MYKKLFSALLIAAVLAAIGASTVSASPVLTENGAPLPVGSSLIWKNTGPLRITASTGMLVECTSAELAATVTKNSGTKFAMELFVSNSAFTGTEVNSLCTTNGYGPFKLTVNSKLCAESNTSDKVTITGCGVNVTWTWSYSIVTCKYIAASIGGSFVTQADGTVGFLEQPYTLEEGSFAFCPSAWILDLDVALTTTNGTTLLIS